MIPYGRQHIGDEEVEAVVAALTSELITQGPRVPAFEMAVAEAVGAEHAVAVNSATSALHIACLAVGLPSGGLLWTSPNSFVASANAGLYCGAAVDFVDIDPATLNMSVGALAAKLEAAEAEGRLPDVVVPVHFGGEPCDMAEIHALSQRYGFRIVEDASHAVGARYRDSRIGDCRYSDVAVFSFHPVKIVTTAEGGLATARDPEVAERMALLRSHGITRDERAMQGASHGPWYYQQVSLGFNYRMTELQAALGIAQMARLEGFLARREALASRYDALLVGLPVRTQRRHPANRSALHLYVVHVDEAETGVSRRALFEALRAAGIGVNVHYIPIHTQPWYQALGFREGMFPAAEDYYRGAITLPLFPDMRDIQQNRVVESLHAALARSPAFHDVGS